MLRCHFLNCRDFFDSQNVICWTVQTKSLGSRHCWIFRQIKTLEHKPCWDLSRWNFLNSEHFFDSWDIIFWTIETKSLDQDHVKTNRDLQAYKIIAKCKNWFLILSRIWERLHLHWNFNLHSPLIYLTFKALPYIWP